MLRSPGVTIDVHLDEAAELAVMAREVRSGLTRQPKRLPSKYFYDERGSRLFERITELPEYYLTRAEQALLELSAPEVARLTRPRELIELGSGSAKKTRLLIEAGRAEGPLERYIPVDVSSEIAETSAERLSRDYPDLGIHAVVGDFERHLDQVPGGSDRLVAFLGSTLGNFPAEQAVDLLRRVPPLLEDGGYLLLGVDLVKERDRLEAAYNDSAGVTAEFNRNILNVINDSLDGDFSPDQFSHVARFNEQDARIETSLRSEQDQSVRLDLLDLEVDFCRGEEMRTEVSCKYTKESVRELLGQAGMTLEHWFTDTDDCFALSLSRPSRRASRSPEARTRRLPVPAARPSDY